MNLYELAVETAVAFGIAAYGEETILDSRVRRDSTRRGVHDEAGSGYGLVVGDGASAEAFALEIADSGVAGIFVDGPGSALRVSGGTVSGNPVALEGEARAAGLIVGGGGEGRPRRRVAVLRLGRGGGRERPEPRRSDGRGDRRRRRQRGQRRRPERDRRR